MKKIGEISNKIAFGVCFYRTASLWIKQMHRVGQRFGRQPRPRLLDRINFRFLRWIPLRGHASWAGGVSSRRLIADGIRLEIFAVARAGYREWPRGCLLLDWWPADAKLGWEMVCGGSAVRIGKVEGRGAPVLGSLRLDPLDALSQSSTWFGRTGAGVGVGGSAAPDVERSRFSADPSGVFAGRERSECRPKEKTFNKKLVQKTIKKTQKMKHFNNWLIDCSF